MNKNYLVILALIVFGAAFIINGALQSRPQYSILQTMGTKCTSCHINPNYGGQRTLEGWMSRNSVSLIDPADIGLGSVWGAMQETNSFLDDMVQFGIDVRFQNARWAQSSKLSESRDGEGNIVKPTLERKFMTMQLMPYLAINATDWLTINGTYNFSYDIHDDMRYRGQQPGWASATIKLGEDLPDLRVGYFTPYIGIDYDDHTYLVRQVAGIGRNNPLVTADYAEWGANLNYDAIEWVNISFGVFEAKNMAELMAIGNTPVTMENTLSTVTNVSFHPSLPFGMNSFFGVSNYFNGSLKSDDGIYFGNGYYSITSVFFNIGLSDKLALLTEYINSQKQSIRTVDNYLVELNYQILEPLNIYARYESASTEFDANGSQFEANQYVFGARIFPLPYIDLIPEYRLYDRGDVNGYSAQWAFQVHLFY